MLHLGTLQAVVLLIPKRLSAPGLLSACLALATACSRSPGPIPRESNLALTVLVLSDSVDQPAPEAIDPPTRALLPDEYVLTDELDDLETIGTLLTGQTTVDTDWIGNHARGLPPDAWTIADALHCEGVTTGLFSARAWEQDRLGFDHGWETHVLYGDRHESRDQLLDDALHWAHAKSISEVFLFVHAPPEFDADAAATRILNDMGDAREVRLVVVTGPASSRHIRFLGAWRDLRAAGSASLADVAPTILDASDAGIPPSMNGRSLASDEAPSEGPAAPLQLAAPISREICERLVVIEYLSTRRCDEYPTEADIRAQQAATRARLCGAR